MDPRHSRHNNWWKASWLRLVTPTPPSTNNNKRKDSLTCNQEVWKPHHHNLYHQFSLLLLSKTILYITWTEDWTGKSRGIASVYSLAPLWADGIEQIIIIIWACWGKIVLWSSGFRATRAHSQIRIVIVDDALMCGDYTGNPTARSNAVLNPERAELCSCSMFHQPCYSTRLFATWNTFH